ncbi:Fructosamine kinase-domain-containing protein [Cercophora samala]|uniref:protein-ribulosamine 3-kinase n=1 Tax=Cercophora samala TaxID=330535 RepID=A0AA39Z0P2_9PEZI|nr:Fructosamine kinase-domain-containing protein [Cercophora samala]
MGNEHTDYTGEIDVPVEAIQKIDPAVVKKLPQGTEVKSVTAHGASFWTRTARLDAVSEDNKDVQYFLKTSYGDRGRKMMSGEFVSMTTIHSVAPHLVPKPLAWGTYEDLDDVHFFLCEFRNMTDELPDIETFPVQMAELHRSGTSPNGKFGFSVTTYHGNTPIEHGWSDTWEDYFTRTTKVLFQMEQEAQGPNPEILELSKPFFEKVVPRLLRPLETDGRSIRPALIHGDLWHGNATMDGDTDQPVIFDAASFYAHNEYELGVWRQSWNKIKKPYRLRYYRHFPRAQPEEDFDDRNLLYATRVNILDSILYKGEDSYREVLLTSLRELVEKFPGGYDEWKQQADEK